MKPCNQENRYMKKVKYRPAKDGEVVCQDCFHFTYHPFPKPCCVDENNFHMFFLKDPEKYTCSRSRPA